MSSPCSNSLSVFGLIPATGSLGTLATLLWNYYCNRSRARTTAFLYIGRLHEDREDDERRILKQLSDGLEDDHYKTLLVRTVSDKYFEQKKPCELLIKLIASKSMSDTRIRNHDKLFAVHILLSSFGEPSSHCIRAQRFALKQGLTWVHIDAQIRRFNRNYKSMFEFVATWLDEDVHRYRHDPSDCLFLNVYTEHECDDEDAPNPLWNYVIICPLSTDKRLENREKYSDDVHDIPFKYCCGLCKECQALWKEYSDFYSTDAPFLPNVANEEEQTSV